MEVKTYKQDQFELDMREFKFIQEACKYELGYDVPTPAHLHFNLIVKQMKRW